MPLPQLPVAELRRLQEYSWPGNVRELQNVVERAVILAKGTVLRFDDVRAEKLSPLQVRTPDEQHEKPEIITEVEGRRRDRDNLRAALEASRGRIYGPGGAAQILGVKPTTLLSRLQALGLRRPSTRRR
jgi:transcriptional regulator with GAF, ATPase, and Fis domain